MSLRELRLIARQPAGPAVPTSEDAPLSFGDLEPALLELYETGLQPGVSTGWTSLDAYYTIKPGLVTVVTGIPHSGKSPFVNAMALHCVVAHGWRVAISSPEHLPYENLAARLLEQFYKTLSFSAGTQLRMTRTQLMQAVDALDHRCWFLPSSQQEATIPNLLTRCQPLLDEGLQGLVIDPYGDFEHRRPPGMTETEYVSGLLSTLRDWARTHLVHLWIVAHPTKMPKQDDGSYAVVKPYDISGSAAWFNKPDVNLSVYRDEAHPTLTQIHIQKVKFREVGHKGTATLRHDAWTGTFYDLPVETEPEE
jgi:twinkle protein